MDALRKAFERCVTALSQLPSLGRSTSVSRTRIRHGLLCEIEEGGWKLTADLPRRLGGTGSAPTPGVFGRAALGSCLAVGYMLHAEKMRVPISSLEVEVQADYDNGSLVGVSKTPYEPPEVRYRVTVESNASEEDIRRVIDAGDAHSPYLHIFAHPQPWRRTVRVIRVSEV